MTIKFKIGDIFEQGINNYDLCLYFGHQGMSFGLPFSLLRQRFNEFSEIENPFATHANQLIKYAGNKALVCIPNDFMTDQELKVSLNFWLNQADINGYKSIALTGVRDVPKESQTDIDSKKEKDNKRVKFIVEIIKEWYIKNKNKTGIKEILLISMSDDYIRNFPEGIISL